MELAYFRVGSGYIGSPHLETSETSNYEVIPESPPTWSGGYSFYKFAFMNDQDCTVIINGGNPIFLRAGQGFSTDYYDKLIESFVIVEEGIQYNWIGAW